MLVLKNVAKHMFTITQNNLNIVDAAATSLHASIETLCAVYQAILPARIPGFDPLHMDQMYKALRSVARVAVDLEAMGDSTSDVMPAIAKTLEDVGLPELVDDWIESDK